MATKITTLDSERQARQIRRQIVDTMADIECMRADYRRIGESSGWEDASLDARYADIERFEGKVATWRRDLRQLAQDARMAMAPAESEWDEPHPAA